MDLIHPLIEDYAAAHTSPTDMLLQEVHAFTLQNHPEARMISGPLQGKLLEMISCMLQPRRILEVGTFTGYSALCLAKGMPADGQLHTIELREEDAKGARAWFDRSGYASQIISHTGNARDIIPQLNETWDLVFIDADKPAYIDYFNLVFPSLRQNGFILADNVLFHGHVLDEKPSNKSAKGIKAFNEFIRSRNDVEKLMITVRDGLYLLRKI